MDRRGEKDLQNARLFEAADGIRTHDLLHGKQELSAVSDLLTRGNQGSGAEYRRLSRRTAECSPSTNSLEMRRV